MEVTNNNPAQKLGEVIIRYGLVIVLAWIGAMKFTAYEAEGIKALVETSPLMSWLYRVLSLQATSNLIGVTELTAATLIAIRPFAPRLSVIGSLLGIFTFLSIDIPVLTAWLGKKPGRLSCFVGFGRFSTEGCGVAGRISVDAR